MRVRKVAFFDRDGTLVEKVDGYLLHPEQLKLRPGMQSIVVGFYTLGYSIVIVTNQRCVGVGLLTEEELERIHGRLRTLLGVPLEIYVCPHIDGCECRKPKPGLLEMAGIVDKQLSFLVGDSEVDTQAAEAFGIRSIRV